MKRLCCYGSYEPSESFTHANLIFTMLFSVFLVCWKGYWITDGWKIFVSIVVGIILFGLLVYLLEFIEPSRYPNCPKHDKEECLECIQVYGFYNEIVEEFEACKDHEDIKLFLFKTSSKDCQKCKVIDRSVSKCINISTAFHCVQCEEAICAMCASQCHEGHDVI